MASSCKKDNNGFRRIFNVPEVHVHDGKAWTWIQIDKACKPERLGITINDAALNSLPIGSDDHTGHDHSGENNWILKSHAKASILPIDHTG